MSMLVTTEALSWSLPPVTLALNQGEVHVWRAELDVPTSQAQRLQRTLAADERDRAHRFYFPRDQRRFVVARGLLRVILGRYLDCNLAQIRFCYGVYGKPALTRECGGNWLRFNVSHSHELVCFAIARGQEIGVDLELMRDDLVEEHIAEGFFSPREVAMLLNLPQSVQKEAFFNCWTRKEAYIKARGEGLSLPLNQFTVSLTPGEPAALLEFKGEPVRSSLYCLETLRPAPGYVGAVAVEGQILAIRRWTWLALDAID